MISPIRMDVIAAYSILYIWLEWTWTGQLDFSKRNAVGMPFNAVCRLCSSAKRSILHLLVALVLQSQSLAKLQWPDLLRRKYEKPRNHTKCHKLHNTIYRALSKWRCHHQTEGRCLVHIEQEVCSARRDAVPVHNMLYRADQEKWSQSCVSKVWKKKEFEFHRGTSGGSATWHHEPVRNRSPKAAWWILDRCDVPWGANGSVLQMCEMCECACAATCIFASAFGSLSLGLSGRTERSITKFCCKWFLGSRCRRLIMLILILANCASSNAARVVVWGPHIQGCQQSRYF